MKSIFSRLIFSFIVIILVAIFSISLFFSGLIKDYMIKQKETELKSKGSQIVELSRDYIFGRIDELTFSYIMDSIDAVVDSRTLIVDRTGTKINSTFSRSDQSRSFKGMKLDYKDLTDIFKGSTIVRSNYNAFFKEPMITVGIPVYTDASNSTVIGAIILNSSVTGVTDAANRTNVMLILASLGGLALSLSGAYLLSKTLSKPITAISRAAMEMAEGNYLMKVDINRQDEIGSLASSFNYLTEKLNTTIGDLHNEKTKLSDILSSMEEGLVAVNRGLNIIHMNPAAHFLLGAGNTFPSTLSAIEGSEDVADSVKEVLESGKSKSYEKSISDNRIINVAISPLRFENGTIYGAIILLQDISESVKLEKMRRDFVANVSHELRTPLTSIRGFIEPLIDGTVDDNEAAQKYHEIIRSETIRLERLINDLLDLSRFQSGKIKLDIQKVNITELIGNISMKFQPIFDSKKIEFIFGKPHRPIFILADGDRIEQLMIIFIDNSVKFTPEHGKVEIILAEEEDLVRIYVRDNGIGIPKEDLPYIWERFYKVDKSRSGKDSGTGLGLSIAKNIIELHGQNVFVESEPGKGTTFEFTMKREA
jgi:signal transduction histidine kinase